MSFLTIRGPWLKEKSLASYGSRYNLTYMITTLSTKGQVVIPESIREQARLKTGDKLDVGYINGLVVLRKRVPLTPAQARALILSGRELPVQTAADETKVQEAVAAIRVRRHSA
jgi:AbrB family looped-hinge helix DNA binding protein